MSSFSTPLSGLAAAQEQLQTISNNLANVNTTAFKSVSVNFSSVYAASTTTNGAGNPVQTGCGSTLSSTVTDQTDGTASETGVASNMAITGGGYFIVEGSDGTISYTRDGSFVTNSEGYLVTTNGSLLLGYPATDGVVDTSAALQAINVSTGTSVPATASTAATVTANLNSETEVGDSASSSVTVCDSLGTEHTLTVTYTKTDDNTWTYSVTIPSDEVNSPDAGSDDTVVSSGTLVFDSTGELDTSSSTMNTISITGLADAADDMSITGPFGSVDSSTGEIKDATITQMATDSATSATYTDGYAAGTLTSYSIDSDGTVQGQLSSGQVIALGQVILASFTNVQGLKAVGDNCYQSTNSSGSAVVGVAGTGGRGTITGGYTESSNVDIASEFSKLIVAQQAYSASAKAITTFNEMSQATLQMLQ